MGAFNVLLLAGRKPMPLNDVALLPLQRSAAEAAPDLLADDGRVMLHGVCHVLGRCAQGAGLEAGTGQRAHARHASKSGAGAARPTAQRFADCCAASRARAAVTAELRRRVGLGGCPLQRQHLWLAQPLAEELHRGMWCMSPRLTRYRALSSRRTRCRPVDEACVMMWAPQSEQYHRPSAAMADAGKQAVAHFLALLPDSLV